MSDLVRELRELAKVWTAAFHGRADILTEAADEIARLTAEVERLQALGEQSMIVMEAASRTIDAYKAVVDAARKQNDYRKGRLKAPNGFLIADELDAALRTLDGEP